jgi:uncharacterized ubiquitin-like protein YukD
MIRKIQYEDRDRDLAVEEVLEVRRVIVEMAEIEMIRCAVETIRTENEKKIVIEIVLLNKKIC